MYEVIAVDSGSTDGTPEWLEAAGVGVLRVRPEDFGHGKTRNLGLAACQGDLVLLTVQDALPQGPGFLASLIRPFLDDPQLAAVRARQAPPPEAAPAARWRAARTPAGSQARRRYQLAPGEQLAHRPPDRALEYCGLDFVATCLRRDVWRRVALPEVPFAEDRAWARQILERGYAWAHEPEAVVLHAHDRPPGYAFRRRYLEARGRRDLLGPDRRPVGWPPVRAVLGTADLARDAAWFAREAGGPAPGLEQLAAAAADLWAGEAGAALGAVDAWRGREWRYVGAV